jgi:hypothetical protein
MSSEYAPTSSDLSPAKGHALFIAALVAALLGLTVLDVDTAREAKRHSGASRSIDCIVANAIFAGVPITPP